MVKKEIAKKCTAITKKRVISSSKSESSSEESSSKNERPKKWNKKIVGKKSKKVVSSFESSSEEEGEIVIDIKETAPSKGIAKLAEGLIAIANQFTVSNPNQTKFFDLLGDPFVMLEVHERKKRIDGDILEVIVRDETITIGTGTGEVHRFESISHLRLRLGKLTTQSNISKSIANLQDERSHYRCLSNWME